MPAPIAARKKRLRAFCALGQVSLRVFYLACVGFLPQFEVPVDGMVGSDEFRRSEGVRVWPISQKRKEGVPSRVLSASETGSRGPWATTERGGNRGVVKPHLS